MAVVKDALGTDVAFTPATAGSQTTTYSGLTVVSNSNGAIVLIVVIADSAVQTPAISSVTGYTFIGASNVLSSDTGGAATWVRVELWGKVGNSTGAQSISITTNSSWTTATTAVFSAISVTGANQTGGTTTFANFVTNKGATTSITSGNVTTATTDLAVAAVADQNTLSGGNHTSIYLDNGPNPSSAAQYAQGATSPVTFTWTTAGVTETWGLVAVDITPVGAATQPHNQDDWPLPQVAEPYPYRSFEWDNRKLLIGKDKLPFGQQNIPLPRDPEPYPYRSFEWGGNRKLLIGKDKLPFRQRDWPLPGSPEVYPYRSFEWGENRKLLIGKDKLPFRQGDWPTPVPPEVYPYRSFEWPNNLNLRAAVLRPFNQRDWPVPGATEPYPYRSFEWDNRNILQGQDALPFRQRDWPTPIAPEPYPYRSWTINLLQTTLAPTGVPFRQTDWPLPVGLPPPIIQNFSRTLSGTVVVAGVPFRQTDWPLPTAAEPYAYRSWTINNQLTTLSLFFYPPFIHYFPIPDAPWELPRTWSRKGSLALTSAPNPKPFSQTDWPLPVAAEPDARRSWASSFNLNLIGKDALPFRQTDWPLPVPLFPVPPIIQNFTRTLSGGVTPPPPSTALPQSNPFSAMHNFGRLGSV